MSSIVDRLNETLGPRYADLSVPQFALVVVSLALLVVVAPALTAVGLMSGTLLRTLALANIFAIFAMAWDIQSGYTGYISFGHAVLSGAAAYSAALLITHVVPDINPWLLFPVAVLMALVVGLILAVTTIRLSGPYFSLITLVAGLLFYRGTRTFSQWTQGEQGLLIGRLPVLPPFDGMFSAFDAEWRFIITVVPMLLIAAALLVISRSNVGTVLVAIRENEAAVESAGIDTNKFKVWSFVLSSIPMGIGGFLLAFFDGSVNPTDIVLLDRSVEFIAMAVIGGMGSILGPLAGAFLFVGLRDAILPAFLGGTERWLALWVIILVVIVLARDGLFRKLWHRLDDEGDAE